MTIAPKHIFGGDEVTQSLPVLTGELAMQQEKRLAGIKESRDHAMGCLLQFSKNELTAQDFTAELRRLFPEGAKVDFQHLEAAIKRLDQAPNEAPRAAPKASR